MAIVEKTFYGVKCDGCGKELYEEYCSEQFTEEVAKESGWLKVRGKHYCENCHQYGDNNELILGDGTIIQEDDEDWI